MPILINTSGSEAELPFSIFDNDNTPVTGYSFSTGDVKVRVPGGVFVDADISNIVECGNGQYVLQLEASQTATEGAVFVAFSDGSERDFFGYEMVTSATDEVLEIPFSVYDGDGVGQTGITFSPGDLTIRMPGQTSFSSADEGNIEEVGFGQYVLVLTEGERAVPGAIFVYYDDGINQRYYGYELNATETESVGGGGGGETLDPIPVIVASPTITVYAHAQSMLNRLPEYARKEVL